MATFLDLLKSKNTNNLQTNPTPPKYDTNLRIDPTPPKYDTNLRIDPTKFFPNQPQIDQQVDPITGPITVRCERSLDAKRLKLFFSAKPSKETLQQLKDQDFKWDNDGIFWHAKDCLVNRMFLAATFDLPDLMQDVYNDDVKPSEPEVFDNPIWTTYKKQVLALQEHLKLDAADLMLKAIDCLYTSTFKVN